jgi:hypothetical protein
MSDKGGTPLAVGSPSSTCYVRSALPSRSDFEGRTAYCNEDRQPRQAGSALNLRWDKHANRRLEGPTPTSRRYTGVPVWLRSWPHRARVKARGTRGEPKQRSDRHLARAWRFPNVQSASAATNDRPPRDRLSDSTCRGNRQAKERHRSHGTSATSGSCSSRVGFPNDRARSVSCSDFPHRLRGNADYLTHSGRIEVAQRMAGHSNAKTTGLYDRRADIVDLAEVAKIGI